MTTRRDKGQGVKIVTLQVGGYGRGMGAEECDHFVAACGFARNDKRQDTKYFKPTGA